MNKALEKIAFLPFGLLIDQWRWKVFAGEVTPAEYNKAWWDLKLKYQGVAPPSRPRRRVLRPGAKYHVPDNTPYTRYFLADILQFQFHRALYAGRRLHAAAQPLLDLREQGGRRAAERDAVDGSARVPGRKRSRRSPVRSRWMQPRSSTTSRRCPKWLDEQLAGTAGRLVSGTGIPTGQFKSRSPLEAPLECFAASWYSRATNSAYVRSEASICAASALLWYACTASSARGTGRCPRARRSPGNRSRNADSASAPCMAGSTSLKASTTLLIASRSFMRLAKIARRASSSPIAVRSSSTVAMTSTFAPAESGSSGRSRDSPGINRSSRSAALGSPWVTSLR